MTGFNNKIMNKYSLCLPLLAVLFILLSCSGCGSLKKTKCKECPVFSQHNHNNPKGASCFGAVQQQPVTAGTP
ncbi:hypothetical protein C7N43_18990 [Sphingobacteriales bacterium UPWRP_1]|nr:hypothetical protein C7N43_18990 [Sphingobacteriales bacterium UPWRP_1]